MVATTRNGTWTWRSLASLRTRRGLTLVQTVVTTTLVSTATLFMVDSASQRIGTACVVGLVVAWTQRSVSRHIAVYTRFLPLMRRTAPTAALIVAFSILGALHVVHLLPLSLVEIGALCLLGAFSSLILLVVPINPRPRLRVGVVGSAATAADLQSELVGQRNISFLVAGHIRPETDDERGEFTGRGESPEPIGALGDLANTVIRERLDLLLLSPTVPRMAFFDEVEATCSHSDVRVLELSAFYERVFGHVPLRAINATWFQWVMHPRYSSRTPPAKRLMDLCIASVSALVLAPVVGLLALLVKLEGGPAFYRQTRIGEGGRSFQILKLRSMRVDDGTGPARWSVVDDGRVTPIGRFLRRTHLDELPQIVNVLKGDMSIVGPRPEQPSFVERLENSVAFYSRRHIVRPGITGWAQVRCGYAGSHEGTLWKLSHDLYYLKHRSVTFDFLILGETVRTLVTGSQFPTELYLPPFVHLPNDPESSSAVSQALQRHS